MQIRVVNGWCVFGGRLFVVFRSHHLPAVRHRQPACSHPAANGESSDKLLTFLPLLFHCLFCQTTASLPACIWQKLLFNNRNWLSLLTLNPWIDPLVFVWFRSDTSKPAMPDQGIILVAYVPEFSFWPSDQAILGTESRPVLCSCHGTYHGLVHCIMPWSRSYGWVRSSQSSVQLQTLF